MFLSRTHVAYWAAIKFDQSRTVTWQLLGAAAFSVYNSHLITPGSALYAGRRRLKSSGPRVGTPGLLTDRHTVDQHRWNREFLDLHSSA